MINTFLPLRVCEHIVNANLTTFFFLTFFLVTTCSEATKALSLLRESKDGFDVVISDVHMPDMDGFRLLELVGLEMDLPVISKYWSYILSLRNS